MKAAWLAVLLTGCGPLMPTLEQQGKGFEAGTYQMCMTLELLATAEEVSRRCNFGLPGGNDLACLFSRADPPIIVAPVPRDVNDWERKGFIGHEVLHIPFGRYHR